MNTAVPSARNSRSATLLFCAAAACLEGFDNQSIGVAAPRLIAEFGLSPGDSGALFSASTLGLAIGAMIGGRVADAVGRKWTLIATMWLFGLGSLLTTVFENVTALLVIRLLTGLGLGGAMPNFLTLASEAVPAHRRLFVVTAVAAALPLGGACAGLVALADSSAAGWRSVFHVGGLAPLVAGAGMIWFLPESAEFKQATSYVKTGEQSYAPGIWAVLFGPGQLMTTLILWMAFFFTQLVLLLLLNWLPSLLVKSGMSGHQASWSSTVFNLGGALGAAVIGHLQSGAHRLQWVAVTYVGMAGALIVIAHVTHLFVWTVAASAAAGIFIIGAQLALYGIAPLYYPTAVRATGVGGAVAVGRLGSIIGPLFAAAMLSRGGSASAVLLAIQPFVFVAAMGAIALCSRPQRL